VLGRAKVREIARYSSVPESKIYYVLERLEEKGLIEIEEERPKHVKAIPVKELAYRMVEHRKKQIENIRIAEKELEEIVETISPIIRENNSKYIRLFKPRYRI
jgi:sugar-specific transcriptional regulator TrmB